ncbi:MAG: hypothetical protein IPP14_12025 [Planctomycetes bacterium]|nr:hypothetical protein [Planctomycetota bacterium]
MDAASVTSFCQVRELSFVEQSVRNGIKGAWFENRRRERSFFAESEIADFSKELRAHPLPRHTASTFTT